MKYNEMKFFHTYQNIFSYIKNAFKTVSLVKDMLPVHKTLENMSLHVSTAPMPPPAGQASRISKPVPRRMELPKEPQPRKWV